MKDFKAARSHGGWVRTSFAIGSVILGLIVPLPCRADDKAAAEKPAAQEESKPVAEAQPKGPPPTGKLGIRKGTGRPGGAGARAQVVEVGPVVPVPDFAEGLQRMAEEERAKEMQKEVLEQLRSAMYEELYFVHLVCKPDRNKRHRLLAAVEPELEEMAVRVARQMATAGNHAGQARVVVRNGAVIRDNGRAVGGALVGAEPRAMLRTALMRHVAEQLGEEPEERLRREIKGRVDSQRQDTIAKLITHLDDLMVLDQQQEEQIAEAMLAEWREDWRTVPRQMPAVIYFPQFYLPKAAQQLLTADQRTRWSRAQKAQFGNQHDVPPLGLPVEQGINRWKRAWEQLDHTEAIDE